MRKLGKMSKEERKRIGMNLVGASWEKINVFPCEFITDDIIGFWIIALLKDISDDFEKLNVLRDSLGKLDEKHETRILDCFTRGMAKIYEKSKSNCEDFRAEVPTEEDTISSSENTAFEEEEAPSVITRTKFMKNKRAMASAREAGKGSVCVVSSPEESSSVKNMEGHIQL